MTTYVIGDVHACFRELENLLVKIAFDPKHDTLWFTGDLVNRGAYPVETLEFVKSLREKAVCVLGNHDLSLLAAAYNKIPSPKYARDFAKVLNYKHKDELLYWILHLPLMHYDMKFNALLVHAGLPPQWDLTTALALAKEVELVLKSRQAEELFDNMYGDTPDTWDINLSGWERLRYIINCYTRMRFCDEHGKLEFSSKTELKDCPAGFKAWFQLDNRKTSAIDVYFGHWASLLGKTGYSNVIAIDTGCAWGNTLSAISLEDKQIFSVPYIRGRSKLV
jgi:bis(5'-nucleosyl)-tetraphosphatase (symmetrical)